MKLLLFIFALLFFVSQAKKKHHHPYPVHRPSAIDPIKLATQNRLHSDMREFGLKEMAKKALSSHGVQFPANPEHKIHTVRTSSGGTLEMTFEADIKDVSGKYHRGSWTVARQAWNNWMGLKSYTLNKK